MLRTHTCGELRKKDAGKKVKLAGWADTIRSYGKLNFVDLRDRYGKTQVVIKGKLDIKPEYCIQISGEVKERKKGTENKKIETGDVEVLANKIEVFNKTPPLPFGIDEEDVGEDVRLKYRYLDLRSSKMQSNLELRHKVNSAIHAYMENAGFIGVETPILAKSTPEGARDYIVPSRVNPGKFYALPQSPQLFKQLLMVAGYDKYYQIARCMRDEDLRADRQPEFTQLDIEMSFVEVDDVLKEMEKLWAYVFKEVLGVKVKTPFLRMTYDEAMKKYKTDSPDLRKNKKDPKEFAFTWVTDFPAFEFSNEDKRWYATHHPFTSPEDGADYSNLGKVKSKAYDLVLNGSEIGGGSIRIHLPEVQQKVLGVLGIDEKEAKDKFGFLLDALSHGAPPHGGIALGLDRIAAIMAGEESIREVIAFPKNKAAQDVMLDAPSVVSEKQLKEVHIKTDLPKKAKKK